MEYGPSIKKQLASRNRILGDLCGAVTSKYPSQFGVNETFAAHRVVGDLGGIGQEHDGMGGGVSQEGAGFRV